MAQDPDGIVKWLRLGPEVTTSGRIEAQDIARLASLGVRHVINLALDESPGALAGEAQLLRKAGLAYTQIPVSFDAPQEHHYAAFCEALRDAERPVHVHCMMNFRVSAFFYRWHREHGGMEKGEARALMEQVWQPDSGERPEMRVWADFIAKTEA